MPYYFFVWTPEIVEHLAEHDVTPEEFEELRAHIETTKRLTGGLIRHLKHSGLKGQKYQR